LILTYLRLKADYRRGCR